MKIELEHRVIDVHVAYGARNKLSVRVDPNGLVTAKAPNGASEDEIARAVRQHGAQLAARLDAIERARSAPRVREYEGEQGKFLHLGRYYKLNELIDTEGLSEEELRLRLKKFYMASCKKVVLERIQGYQKQLRVTPKSIEIMDSITKWGSCSSNKQLTFNYRLAMAPVEVIDYVIIHELCHLLHMNHDRSFWRRVGSIMPDYKEKEAFLDRYGHAMEL
ncbi:M48 family metallopeptidase [Paenibacillus sp. MWE-103]|uniref:M48 family metallopeptidase n=1 Tax=Paenibacillus artemisiicola TaxID=1172618 RepID=A0ABS3WEZ8_9BACL|nr:SprT family zinc-dependent metalloprotease [Paenibacillus artemisiicola]MBO7746896.1 M48 family metallopeptidase [Paenibacillus artemisiicola]